MSDGLAMYKESEEIAKSGIPLRRKGAPQDMAGAALFLSSNAGAWITGTTVRVDGGFLAKL